MLISGELGKQKGKKKSTRKAYCLAGDQGKKRVSKRGARNVSECVVIEDEQKVCRGKLISKSRNSATLGWGEVRHRTHKTTQRNQEKIRIWTGKGRWCVGKRQACRAVDLGKKDGFLRGGGGKVKKLGLRDFS